MHSSTHQILLAERKFISGSRGEIIAGNLGNTSCWISMDNGDKSWMYLLRWTDEYIRGVNGLENCPNIEDAFCPNIEDAFWREPNDDIGPLSGLVDADVRWSRDDVPVDVVDIPSNAQHSNDTIIETSEEEDEFDDTDWDWMESDE